MSLSRQHHPPHIAHILGTANFGGVQRMLLGIAKEFRARGWRQSAVCIVNREGALSEEFAAAFDSVVECRGPWPTFHAPRGFYRIGRALRYSLACTFPLRLGRALRQLGPDIVHTHISSRLAAQASATLKSAHVPFVWTIHGDYKINVEQLPDWRKAALLLRERQDQVRVAAVSREVARNIAAQVPALSDLLEVVHCGVDLSGFRRDSVADVDMLRRAWNIPPQAFVFGSTGRLVEAKAYEHFVAAAANLRECGVDAYFLLAGEGPLRGRIEEAIRRHDLADCFYLTGFQADVPRFLRSLNAFVLSSRTEGIPLSLIEAMAAGLPCVATDVGGVTEVLDNQAGMIVPAENPAALADAMLAVIKGAVGPAQLAHASCIADDFGMENCASRFAAMYEDLLRVPIVGTAARSAHE